ncbi:MAG: formate dehydrogenase accessory sulfurtransferase FdhD [Gammaproteobacteria bacterium]|nr:formate dehydrogenase accessory sulfurtransferase FdhD [Gammaproteobacteria bacterium]
MNPEVVSTSRGVSVSNWRRDGVAGSGQPVDDRIASEVPVALTYNRVSHVVMMATPADLEDFAVGFSITEGLIGGLDDLRDVRIIPREGGIELAMTISEEWFDRLNTQRRNMTGRTGCGLCGAENIEQALRQPTAVERQMEVRNQALQKAISVLEDYQPLQAETGASHGAAWCALDGEILQLREDIGRHNALDKVIGSLFRSRFDPAAGFLLVSSRASYEMVYKTAAAGVELIMAVSAPTTLAVEFALRTGVTLVGFARPGRHNIYTFGERISD